MGQIKIIGGQWRGRKITVLDADGLRPTANRMRETLFNWLGQDLTGKRCLDLYAGSGILSLESASRGALHVDAVDHHPKAIGCLEQQIALLNATQIEPHLCSASAFLAQARPCYDIIFLDPPFHRGEAASILQQLPGCLNETTVVYLETERDFVLQDHWQVLREKRTQQALCRLIMPRRLSL